MGKGIGRRELPGLVLLALAVVFNLIFLAPEIDIGRFPPNDNVLHLVASERIGESLANGEPFLDPWVSHWSLGYPFWRSYQPLPHVIAAAVLALSAAARDPARALAILHALLVALLPASLYVGARLLGLAPTAAGTGSILSLLPSSWGEYGRYGIGYGATTWRGSGLFTQVVALHFLSFAIGATARSLDTGRRRLTAAALVATTALSHIVFGYVAFVSSALVAIVGPRGRRPERLVRLATIVLPSLLLLAWFVLPLLLVRGEVNHSRWEPEFKWDSFGAADVLREIASGRFFDAGRFPILTCLVAGGALVAGFLWRDVVARRLLALATLWLALFFGRATWGYLLLLAGVPGDLHLHRLQAAFELSALLLASFGVASALGWLWSVPRSLAARVVAVVLATLVGVGVLAAGRERAHYLGENRAWGQESLEEVEREQGDVAQSLALVRSILAERPGRVSAGKASTWGKEFKVGSVPFYAFLTREHLDQVSFLYHAMSLPSDIMVERDEGEGTHDTAMGVRAVVAPADREMPPHLRLRGRANRFAVYESSREGYFGLVDIAGRYTGPASTRYEPSSSWLRSDALRRGIVYALDGDTRFEPAFGRWEALPQAPAALLEHRGTIVSELKEGETYRARVELARPCHAFVKITWHPDLVATVDGNVAPLVRVTPGFGAVPVPAGEHEVVVRYAPGPLKPLLLGLGIASFAGLAYAWHRRRDGDARVLEEAASGHVARLGDVLARPRLRTSAILLAIAVLALRPLVRGRLVDGHDATEYPPRLVEFASALRAGPFPPVWAPDLGAGHGQPLFGFAPPLVYYAALPFHAAGMGLADCLQFGLFFLHLVGAFALYRAGRSLGASREASLGGAAAWLFVPYLALDLFVRTAFAEAAAFAMAPVALLGVLRAVAKPCARNVVFGAGAVALVVLSHNAAALLLAPALAAIACARAFDVRATSRGRVVQHVGSGAGALAAGLGLSAFFWLPAFAEREFVKVELLREGFLHWREHAISTLQLLWGPWGHGFSVPGTGDGMSFALGPVHLLLAGAGLVAVFLPAQLAKTRATHATMAIVALGGAWLATSGSAAVWEAVGPLQYFAYPWRALLLPGLLLPLLAIPAFERLGRGSRIAAVAFLVVCNLPHTEPKRYLTFDDEFYAPRSIAEKGLHTTTREEYEPRWVESRPPYAPREILGRGPAVDAQAVDLAATRQEWKVSAAADTEVEANTFYYPGWHAIVDGIDVPVAPVPVRGTMTFPLPSGEHRVVLEFRRTPLRRRALAASAATLLGLAGWLAVSAVIRRRPPRG